MIHPSAVIADSAVLADDVAIGPYTVIGENVEIGSGTRIESHVVVQGPTRLGTDTHFFQFSSIGDARQDKKYEGEE